MKNLCLQYLYLFILINVIAIKVTGQNQNKLDSLLFRFEISKNDSTRVATLLEISNHYLLTDLQLSFEYSEKALGIAEQNKNRQLYAQVLMNIGNNYFYQGLLDLSVKNYYKVLEINRELKDDEGLANVLTNLGGVLLQLHNFEEAKKNFHEALPIFVNLAKRKGDTIPPYQIISIYNNLGIAHENLNEYNQAIDYYHRGISLAKRMPAEMRNLAMLYNNLGSIHMKKGEYEKAFQNMDIALKIRKDINDKNGEASSYRMLGLLYRYQNNYHKALDKFYAGYTLASEVGNTSILSSLSEQFFEIYSIKNQSDSALKYHVLLKNYSDRINAEETKREFTRMEVVSHYKEKEKINLIEQKKQAMRHLFIAVVLSLIAIILGLLYILTQNRLRRVSLMNKNIQLATEKAELERETLSKELELKNKELTTNVMYQIRKNELINSIAEKLMANSHNFKKENQNLISEIIKELENTQEDNVWSEFESRFHQVHNEFYDKLNEINPELSPNERRLCAFLRLNMSTKEISSITNQSLRSIEVARTRLRKKLKLTNTDLGLIEFLSTL
jgi:tetratricopeptide (TPR) repeat protein